MDIIEVTALFPEGYKRHIDCDQPSCSAKQPCLQCISHEVKHLYLDGKGDMAGGYPGWENKHFVNDTSQFLWDCYLSSIYAPIKGVDIFSKSIQKLNKYITLASIASNIIYWLFVGDIGWFLLIGTIFLWIWLNAKATNAKLNASNILGAANIFVQKEFRNSWLHQDLHGRCRCFKCGDLIEVQKNNTENHSEYKDVSDKEGVCLGCGYIFWPRPIEGSIDKQKYLSQFKIPTYRPTFKKI